MSKSIYDEALEIVDESLYQQDNSVIFNHLGLNLLKKALEQAKKQEQEHIKYSKKVQEHFSNDTKRIGELESKLIKQEKLLELYRYLDENANDYDLHYDKVDEIHNKIEELENE